MERKKQVGILIAIGLIIALVVVVLNLPTDERTVSTVFGIVSGFIGWVLTVLVWAFKEEIEKLLQESKVTPEQKEHTKFLTDKVLRRLLTVSYVEINDHLLDLHVLKGGRTILLSYSESIKELDYWKWTESHLKDKKYANIWKPFSNARTLIEEHNQLVKQFVAKLQQKLKDEMLTKFPTFTEYTNEDLSTENYFHVRHLVNLLYYGTIYYVETSKKLGFNDLRCISDGNIWRVEADDSRLLLKTPKQHEANKDKLQEVLSSISDEQSLTEEAKKLYEIRQQLDEPLRQFKERLQELIKKVDGGFVLEGKCELGY